MPQDVIRQTADIPQASGGNFPETGNRRRHPRHPGRAVVHIVRECDPARTPIPAKVLEISVAGIGLICAAPIATNEQIRVCMKNDIQRFAKDIRGTVRWVSPTPEGEYRFGVEFGVQLSANDLMSVTRTGATSQLGAAKVWM